MVKDGHCLGLNMLIWLIFDGDTWFSNQEAISWNVHWSNIYSNTGSSLVPRPTRNNFRPPSPWCLQNIFWNSIEWKMQYVFENHYMGKLKCIWEIKNGLRLLRIYLDFSQNARLYLIQWIFFGSCKGLIPSLTSPMTAS